MPFHQLPLNLFTSGSAHSQSPWANYDLEVDVASGIAVFFGGEAAVSTLALQPMYGRLWHGWYNAPGCHAIVWELVKTLLQGPVSSYPERLPLSLGLDGKEGPKYIASQSGTVMEHTCHLAHVLNNSNWSECTPVGQRFSSTPMQLMIIDIGEVPTEDTTLPPRSSRYSSLSIIASIASIAACAMCARVEDWSSFAMILLGIVSSGVTSFVMSTGKITLTQLSAGDAAPPGDGMLLSDSRIVILRGREEDVNAVTKGKLRLKLKGGRYTLPLCAFIGLSQATLQLIHMPSASLPGQIMFLLSLLVSGGCNLYLSAKKHDVQSSALIALLNTPKVKTYQTNSRTTAAVLACLALCWKSGTPPILVFQNIVPIQTKPWKALLKLLDKNIEEKNTLFTIGDDDDDDDDNDLTIEEGQRLEELIGDAQAAYQRYIQDDVLPAGTV